MDREAAIAKARKLWALAEHPDTPEKEALSARKKLLDMRDKYLITDRELGMSDGRPWTRDALFSELTKVIGHNNTERVYRVFRIDYLLDGIYGKQSRTVVDGALAELVRMVAYPKKGRRR